MQQINDAKFTLNCTVLRRKGRNVYRTGTSRQPWADECARALVLEDKHRRGTHARNEKAAREGCF